MSGFEVERRFLIKKGGIFKRAAFSSSHIQQGYVPCLDATVKVRVRDDKTCLTIKGKSTRGGTMHYELKTKIMLEEASYLPQLCQGDIINKRRYLVRSGDHVFEVNEFYGDNEGPVAAEVELRSENESYEKPDSIGPEVTGDARLYNKYIFTSPFSARRDTLLEEYR